MHAIIVLPKLISYGLKICVFNSPLFIIIFIQKLPQQFQTEYVSRAVQNGYHVSDAGGRAYDAVWVLALALNRTMAMVGSGNINGTGCENATGSLVPLEQFQYSNERMGCLIQWNIQRTNISGVSVRNTKNC